MRKEIFEAIENVNLELLRPHPTKSNTNKFLDKFFRLTISNNQISSFRNFWREFETHYDDESATLNDKSTWQKEGVKKLTSEWLRLLQRYFSGEFQQRDDEIISLQNQLKQLQTKDYENRIIKLTPQLFINYNSYWNQNSNNYSP